MGTLSKAVAGLGGFAAGSNLIRDYLVNHARSLIYSTGLPHSVIAFDLASVRYIRDNPSIGSTLLDNARAFRDRIISLGFDCGASTSQIIPLIVGDERTAVSLSRFLLERGIKAPAIRPPTVPSGTARVRLSLHAGIDEEAMGIVVGSLREWKRDFSGA